MKIPLYNLRKAQTNLEDKFSDKIKIFENGFLVFFEVTKKCKLYNYENHYWTDFKGNATGKPIKELFN
jgi:omega-6 fatty acid desaturase (delta-12 desaturase)